MALTLLAGIAAVVFAVLAWTATMSAVPALALGIISLAAAFVIPFVLGGVDTAPSWASWRR